MLATNELATNHSRQPEPGQSEQSTPRVLTILSFVIEKLVARNDRLLDGLSQQLDGARLSSGLARVGKSLSAFHGVRAPSISIQKYLERLYKYTSCSPSCFVVGYVYIDRLVHKHPDSLVISLNVHRLLVTSVMIASKMLDDVHCNNAFYARVGGVSNAELNRLEMELLFLLDFGVMVTYRVFESYCLHLEKEMMFNGAIHKVERALVPAASSPDDHATEISVEVEAEDTQTFSQSPPQVVD